jgi:hypothetical protein
MQLIIQDLPAKVWENLDKKAKASGRTVEAEVTALLCDSFGDESADDMDDLQKMVYDMYGGGFAERRSRCAYRGSQT